MERLRPAASKPTGQAPGHIGARAAKGGGGTHSKQVGHHRLARSWRNQLGTAGRRLLFTAKHAPSADDQNDPRLLGLVATTLKDAATGA